MSNSIANSISIQRDINKLKLLNKLNKKKIIIYCEGKSDEDILKKLFFEDNIEIFNLKGKQEVLKKINESEKINKSERNIYKLVHIIAIIDKDYSKEEKIYKNLFFYDYCCLEMMLMSSKKVQEALYLLYCKNKENLNCEIFFMNILNSLKNISLIRKYNDTNKCINTNKLIKINNLYIDNEKEYINNKKLLQDKEILGKSSFLDTKKDDYSFNELLDITNGHDFSELLKEIFNRNTDTNGAKIKREAVEQQMRNAYSKECFKNTKLYKKLIKYQFEENITLLFD